MLWAVTFKLSFSKPIEQRNRLPCYLGPVLNLVLGSVGQVGTGGLTCGLWTSWYTRWAAGLGRIVLLILLTAPAVSLLTLSVLFDGPVVDKVWVGKLEGDLRSPRICRHVYPLLADPAADAAATTVLSPGWHSGRSSRHAVFSPLKADTAVMRQ